MEPTGRTIQGVSPSLERPAFYALRPGGWRDFVTLLHPPYTAWNLASVAIGAALAPHMYPGRLAAALAAFFLAVGVGAHVLDELRGRPLGTHLSSRTLVVLAVLSLTGAAAIGIVGAVTISLTLIPFVLAGVFIVLAYNLEWFGGRFHGDRWFALSWGALPVLAGYVLQTNSLSAPALCVAAACALISLVEIKVSRPYKDLRRHRGEVADELLAARYQTILKSLSSAVILLGIGLALARWLP